MILREHNEAYTEGEDAPFRIGKAVLPISIKRQN
jgi:hypothetical protein